MQRGFGFGAVGAVAIAWFDDGGGASPPLTASALVRSAVCRCCAYACRGVSGFALSAPNPVLV
ncbi:hypothetical protein RFN57_34020 [Streptomyces violaceochromogenes]|uniref:Secreted protein n=1 Tax=Streptomyces violaceochromogenes TaxID=67377 RepID=A0ABU6M680_9ACTN|nr:hypothetical protein [Streptomyces violaceochromogenes]MEC7057265.1 hypothetical protein [Streptomyces violaceochromogenes]GHC93669.1 hypothetical protein GCM10010309_78290 [Streptomyces violaceochromogenes]